MKRISLIVVNYFTSQNIKQLLNSLEPFEHDNLLEIIIVNNSPQDNFIKELSNYKNVKIINSNLNVGFGAGCNIGAKYSSGDFLVFVNPDVVFISSPFNELISFLDKNINVGVAGVILMNHDGSPQYSFNDFPDIKWEIAEFFGNSNFIIQQKLQEININPVSIDWVIGAFMFMRKSVFNEVHGFDSDYFLYYEDTDLQKRIRSKGYINYLLPDIKLIHGTKSSIQGEEGSKIYNNFMNKSKMLYHYKHSSFLKRNVIRLLNLLRILSRIVLIPFKLHIKKNTISTKLLWWNIKTYLRMKDYFYGR